MNILQKVDSRFIPIFLLVSVFLLSIGYASINSIISEIEGTVIAKKQDGIFITDVVYDSNINAIPTDSKINSYYQTTLNSKISLSTDINNGNSAITYIVTIYNSTDDLYRFNGVKYGDNFYDNDNIVFKLTNIKKGTKLASKGYVTFYITFSYLDGVVADNNVLNSYLNFEFVRVGDLDIDYTIEKTWVQGDSQYYRADFVLTNRSGEVVDNWNVEIPFPIEFVYSGGWGDGSNVVIHNNEPDNIIISNVDKLAIGGSVKFSVQFGVNDNDFDFIDIFIDNTFIDVPDIPEEETVLTTSGIKVDIVESTSWPSGSSEFAYLYNLTVTNTTSEPITDWKVVIAVPYGGLISSCWNLEYENYQLYVVVKPPSDNTTLYPGQSYNSGGFIIEGAHANFQPVIK